MTTATLKKPSRGLGKGLSALMSDTYSQASANEPEPVQPVESKKDEIPKQTLPLNKIHSGKYQPRTFFDESALSELARSIERNGVIQPIVVRKSVEDKYEIIAGERRWRAAKIAGLDEIPAVVRDIPDEHALEVAIVENVQREGLHPLEEAAGYQRLMDEFGYTQDNIATTVYKSRSHIANLLRLLTLPQDIQELFTAEKISMGHARTLIGAPNAMEIAEEIIRRNLSVRQTEKLVNRAKNPNAIERTPRKVAEAPIAVQPVAVAAPVPVPQPQGPKDQDILALEETLSENLGLKVSINDRGQAGEITIAYATLEQLDDILRRLGGSI